MIPFIICILAGASLPLAFAPFHVVMVSFLAPTLLLSAWYSSSTPMQAFYRGLAFGFGLYSLGISWIYISIHNFGNASTLLAAVITLLVIAVLALIPAVQGFCLVWIFGKKNRTLFCLAAFPASWVLFETVKTIPLNGFPWLLLGYTQLSSPLKGYAALVGVYGISLIVSFICGCCVVVLRSKKAATKDVCIILIAILVIGGWLLEKHEWTHPLPNNHPPIKVSLIQGNFPQLVKWDPNYLLYILKSYASLTKEHLDSQLIVWPEGAIPTFPDEVIDYLHQLDTLAKEKNTNILLGIPLIQHGHKNIYYNGLLLIGAHHGQYLKHHLVPFGEYTPAPYLFTKVAKKLGISLSDFSPGSKQQGALDIGFTTIRTMICYEIAFSREVIRRTKPFGQIIVAITDDSWFGQSNALFQHLEIAQMRALETGREVLLAGNTGVTAFINAKGELLKALPLNTQQVLTGMAIPMFGKTPLMYWRYHPLHVIIVLLFLLAYFVKKDV